MGNSRVYSRTRRAVPWLMILMVALAIGLTLWFVSSPMSVLRHRFWPEWLEEFEQFVE